LARSGSENPDFGYAHFSLHWHLLPALIATVTAAVSIYYQAPWWVLLLALFLLFLSLAGYATMHLLFRPNASLKPLSVLLLPEDKGRILDLGCGSGRSTIMAALGWPHATVTALDDFSAGYIRDHWPERLMENLRRGRVADRVSIVEGDMLELPYADEAFDALVSVFAVDHTGGGIPSALAEARHVLRTGGRFLLVVIVPNLWMTLAFGPVPWLFFPSRRQWDGLFRSAGFRILQEGSCCGGHFFLLS
jgi:SAM-dependent methyltransferase